MNTLNNHIVAIWNFQLVLANNFEYIITAHAVTWYSNVKIRKKNKQTNEMNAWELFAWYKLDINSI